MNANELADALEKDPMRWTILENAITMLRQQQAEIEVLKAQDEERFDLTNDEIKEVIKSLEDSIYFDEKLGFFELKDFALAILRKARDK